MNYIRRLYASPAPELDLGTFRQSGLLLISFDFKGFHFDTNGIFSEQTEGIVHRLQYGQTLSISHSLRKLTISTEIWHFSQPFLRSNAVGNLWAVSYSVRRNLVIDVGFDHGFTTTSSIGKALAASPMCFPIGYGSSDKKSALPPSSGKAPRCSNRSFQGVAVTASLGLTAW